MQKYDTIISAIIPTLRYGSKHAYMDRLIDGRMQYL